MSFTSPTQPMPLRRYRSKLIVPAAETRFLSKAASSAADAICLDLEDGVAISAKDLARDRAIAALNEIEWGDRFVSVRINGLDTRWCYRDVIALVENAPRLNAIMIPRVGNAADVYAIDMLASQAAMTAGRERPVMLEALIETAQGLAQVEAIAGASPRLASLHFGHGDLSVSLGMRTMRIAGDSSDYVALAPLGEGPERARHLNDPWHYGLVRTITAARASGVLVCEASYGDYRDHEGLEVFARRAAYLGCDGKWAIHPDQIAAINAAFTPPTAQVAEARAILLALAAAQAAGKGAIVHNGVLVDMLTIRQAQQLVDLADLYSPASAQIGAEQ